MRQEIARLENQLNQFNGKAPLKVLYKLCDELSAAKTRMQALLDDAAIAGKKLEDAFKTSVKIDLSTPESQLKAFDAQVQRMCSSLDAYFETVKSKLRELQSLMGDSKTIAENIKVNDANVRRIEEMKRQNVELQEQIQRQTEEIERQKQQWQQLADAVRNNNVAAIQQLSQQTDEATRRLRMDAAKGSINGITEELNEMAEKMAVAEGKAETLKAILDDLRNRNQNGDATISDSSIADAEQAYQKANDELKKMKAEYNSMSAEQKKYVDQLKDACGHHARMRTQIIDAREKMAQLIASGQTGTPAFRQLAEQAAVMRRQITLANATMQYFSNPTRHLETLKVTMQGVAGAAGLVTGIFGIFNSESEKIVQIQTKVQSALAIVVGLETTYATVKKTSNVMMAVSEFQAWAATKAKLAEAAATNAGTLATIKATAAQRAFNLVASMNPYVLLATAIGALGVALFSFTKSAKTATEAEKELTKAQEEQRKVNEKLGSSVGDTIAEYMLMQKQWESLSTAHEKNSWIDENKTKFKQMGLTIGDINTAEKVFVDHSKEVIAALKARAEAEAWGEIYKERIKKKAENDMNGSIANGRYLENFHAGDRVNVGKLRQTYGKTVNTNTVGGSEGYFRVDGTHFGTSYSNNEFVRLTEESARDLNAKALEMANAITKAEDDAIKLAGQQMDEAQKRAAEAQLDLQRKIGNSGIGSGNDTSGKSPDEIVRMQMQQEQEAIRQRQQNLLLQEQAVIDQMQDGTEKELAQMRLSHKKRMHELDNEEQDVLNKKIDSASNDKKGNPIKGFYTSGQYRNVQLTDEDMLGVNSKRISESESYADGLVALFKKIGSSSESTADRMNQLGTAYRNFIDDIGNLKDQGISDDEFQRVLENVKTQFTKTLDGIHKEEQDAMRDYLKEYGTYEERRKAITEEYEEKISNAKTDGERLILQKKQEEELDALEARYGKTKQFMIDLFGDVSKKSIAEIGKIIKKYEELEKFLSGDKTVSRKKLISLGFTDEEIDKALEKLNQGKITVKEFTDALKNMKGELAERSPWQKFKKEINDAVDMLKKSKGDSDKIGTAIENIGEACTAYLPQVEKFASGLYSIFGIDDSAAKNAITAINGLSTATTGIGQIISGNYLDGITNTVDGLSQSFNGLADMINDIYSKRDMDDVYNNIELEAIRKSVDKIVEKMDSSTIAEAIDEYENAMERYNEGLLKAQQNVQDAFSESSSSLAGRYNHRSINYYMNDIGSKDDIDQINRLLGTNLTSFGDLWLLSPDQLAEIEEKLPYVFSIIEKGIETMSENASASSDDEWAREALAAYMEFVGKKKEIEDAFNQKMTGTTYDTVKNEFKNILLDMTSDAEKFSEKFEDMLVNAIVNSMMSDKYNEELKEWYQAFSDAFSNNNGIDEDEARQLRDRYNDIVNAAIAERNNLFETLNINTDDTTKQEADKKGFQAMSQDTGEELNGRFTALQIAGENVSEQVGLALPILNDIGVSASRTADMVDGLGRVADDMLTHIVESYTELNLIRVNTDDLVKIGKENQQTLKKMASDLKRI